MFPRAFIRPLTRATGSHPNVVGRCTSAHAARYFANITASDLRQGMVFLENGIYCEVNSYRPVKQGRGAASANITYTELPNGKQKEASKAASGKVNKVELDKEFFEFLYIDGAEICLADKDFNEKRVSMDYVKPEFASNLKDASGVRVTAFKDKDTIVKLSFPVDITAKKK